MPFRSAGAAFVDSFVAGRGLRQRDRTLDQRDRALGLDEDEFKYRKQRDQRGDRFQAETQIDRARREERAEALALETQRYNDYRQQRADQLAGEDRDRKYQFEVNRDRRAQEEHDLNMAGGGKPAAPDPRGLPGREFQGPLQRPQQLVEDSPLGVPFDRPFEAAMRNPDYAEAVEKMSPEKRVLKLGEFKAIEMGNRVAAEMQATDALIDDLADAGVLEPDEVTFAQEMLQGIDRLHGSDDVNLLHSRLEQAKEAYVEKKQKDGAREAAVQSVKTALASFGIPAGEMGAEMRQNMARLMYDPTIDVPAMEILAGNIIIDSNPYVQKAVEHNFETEVMPGMVDMAARVSPPTAFDTGGATLEGAGTATRATDSRAAQQEAARPAREEKQKSAKERKRLLAQLRRIEGNPKLTDEEKVARQTALLEKAGLDYSMETFEALASDG